MVYHQMSRHPLHDFREPSPQKANKWSLDTLRANDIEADRMRGFLTGRRSTQSMAWEFYGGMSGRVIGKLLVRIRLVRELCASFHTWRRRRRTE